MKGLDGIGAKSPEAYNVPCMRLVKAAHEFEAQLMKELMKPLTTGEGFYGDGNDTGSGGILQDFAGEALGRALSEQGGLGIAESILRSLSRLGIGAGIETVPGKSGASIEKRSSGH